MKQWTLCITKTGQ